MEEPIEETLSNFLELPPPLRYNCIICAFVFFSSSICAFVFFLVVFVPCVFIFVHFVMADEPIEETPATFLSCLPHFTAHYILANFSLTVLHNKNFDSSFWLSGFNGCLFMYLAL